MHFIICNFYKKRHSPMESALNYALCITNYALKNCPFAKYSRISQKDKIY